MQNRIAWESSIKPQLQSEYMAMRTDIVRMWKVWSRVIYSSLTYGDWAKVHCNEKNKEGREERKEGKTRKEKRSGFLK